MGTLTVVAGGPKSGKTTYALHYALNAIRGGAFHGQRLNRREIYIVGPDNERDIFTRVATWRQRHRGGRRASFSTFSSELSNLAEVWDNTNKKPGFVIVDGVADQRTICTCQRIKIALDAHVILTCLCYNERTIAPNWRPDRVIYVTPEEARHSGPEVVPLIVGLHGAPRVQVLR